MTIIRVFYFIFFLHIQKYTSSVSRINFDNWSEPHLHKEKKMYLQ